MISTVKAALTKTVEALGQEPATAAGSDEAMALLQACKTAVSVIPGEEMERLLVNVEKVAGDCQQRVAHSELAAAGVPIVEVSMGDPDAQNLPKGAVAKLGLAWATAKTHIQNPSSTDIKQKASEIMQALDELSASALCWDFPVQQASSMLALMAEMNQDGLLIIE